jgi:hypothetical protein
MTETEELLQSWDDSIVSKVRQVREALLAEFNYDLGKYTEELRRKQADSNRQVVTRSPRRPIHGNGEAA